MRFIVFWFKFLRKLIPKDPTDNTTASQTITDSEARQFGADCYYGSQDTGRLKGDAYQYKIILNAKGLIFIRALTPPDIPCILG